MITRFTNGPPNQLAFFNRASRATNFKECLHIAKIGEAHGYRSVDTFVAAAVKSEQYQLPDRPRNTYRQRKVRCFTNVRAAFNCQWTGQGGKHRDVICQLCDQRDIVLRTVF